MVGWRSPPTPVERTAGSNHGTGLYWLEMTGADIESANRAAHVFAAAHGRFNLAVAIRAFRNLNLGAIIQGQTVIYQRRITFGTCHVYGHTTLWTFVCRHLKILPKS